MTHLDPRTNQCELEVQRIIHLQNLVNQLSDAFIDTKKVTKSHISAANTPAWIDVPVGQLTNESKIRLKRGRPIGSKDVTPRKRRTQEKLGTLKEAIKMTDQFKIDKSIALEEAQIMQKAPEEVHIEQEAPEEAHIEQETPEDPHIEREAPEEAQRNENNEIIRYKARLVAQGFSQRPGIDYEETYSPVMDAITFRFLISLAVSEGLDMRLMDVITAYLYGSMDNDIYMKIPEGFKLPDANKKPRIMYSIKLQRSLYGLKQSGRMWYNRLSEYLLKEGYVNNPICPFIFIKKSETGFAIIAVYVDDLNLVRTPEELTRITNYLKKEFEMKDLGKTKFCLGLQIEHFPNGVLVHQSTYIKKVLKRFYMDKAHPLSSPMVVRSLDVKKDPFRPCENDEELLGPEVPYLSAIGALMYLANCTRPDIAFSVNLLARYSSAPTRRHWNGIKHILRYLRGTTDMGLFYSRESKQQLFGYADAGYLSNPQKGRSQTGYVFNCNGTAISWRSVKQTMVVTSSNHSEILTIHETSRECIWLRSMIQHIRESCGLSSIKGIFTATATITMPSALRKVGCLWASFPFEVKQYKWMPYGKVHPYLPQFGCGEFLLVHGVWSSGRARVLKGSPPTKIFHYRGMIQMSSGIMELVQFVDCNGKFFLHYFS
ncbi:hypothetical protein VitviT2T_012812 [Vitis vinifera]|uniref:Reverse transcriptase Ty1/copia-type domain-containing protein n=1 Tax=Vitis vinifera TaxID=29760 RepID=A0ABY9CEU1_VITVI|nr:hypothetical protein VitviT2T_012812 [Vitis vinifera]